MSVKSETEKIKFEFGRHATFHLREGWMSKGVGITDARNGFIPSLETADQLGLGSRMVKSLAFWLEATNLTYKSSAGTGTNRNISILSDFGRKVCEFDPYFEFPMTLWSTHINLANRQGTVWNWFFNDFRKNQFNRESCIENFVRFIQENASNPAVLNTCQREVNCLLALYCRPSIGEMVDPEDVTISPFRSLGLLTRDLNTGNFEKTKPMDRIPLEAFLAVLSCMHKGNHESGEIETVRLSELVGGRNSPGRLMNMESSMVSDFAEYSENQYSNLGIKLSLSGSDRVLSFPIQDPGYWLKQHFDRISKVVE